MPCDGPKKKMSAGGEVEGPSRQGELRYCPHCGAEKKFKGGEVLELAEAAAAAAEDEPAPIKKRQKFIDAIKWKRRGKP